MRKKLLVGLLAVSMALAALFGLAACGGKKHVHKYDTDNACAICGKKWKYTEGLRYELNDDGESYGVFVNNGASGEIVLPYYYEGNPVTSIWGNTFNGCSGLTGIVIPDSVKSIGYKAFYNCSGLTSIVIPDSVTSIGNYVFKNCSGLTSVVIGNGVKSIGDGAFEDCLGLTSIEIPNSVTSIGSSAFGRCSSLTSIVIPESVTTMGSGAFGCENLTIYCEAESQPSGWAEGWNYSGPNSSCPVVWGYKGEE